MKMNYSFTAKMDRHGRILVPKKLRQLISIDAGTELYAAYNDNDELVITKKTRLEGSNKLSRAYTFIEEDEVCQDNCFDDISDIELHPKISDIDKVDITKKVLSLIGFPEDSIGTKNLYETVSLLWSGYISDINEKRAIILRQRPREKSSVKRVIEIAWFTGCKSAFQYLIGTSVITGSPEQPPNGLVINALAEKLNYLEAANIDIVDRFQYLADTEKSNKSTRSDIMVYPFGARPFDD